MPNGGDAGDLHEASTTRSGHRYIFYKKHHDYAVRTVSQWAQDLTREAEFVIFNLADERNLASSSGDLYGLRLGDDRAVMILGTMGQQIAEFPFTNSGTPWHGYPLGPLVNVRPPHPPKRPLPMDALDRMVAEGLLLPHQKKRLRKGDHA
jgi:hypothetical protein